MRGTIISAGIMIIGFNLGMSIIHYKEKSYKTAMIHSMLTGMTISVVVLTCLIPTNK